RSAVLLIFFSRHQAQGLAKVLLVNAPWKLRARKGRQTVVALYDDVSLIQREHMGIRRGHAHSCSDILTQVLVFDEPGKSWDAGLDDMCSRCATSGYAPPVCRCIPVVGGLGLRAG